MTLAADVGEIGSMLGALRFGIGIRTAAEALGEWYGAIGMSASGDRNGRGSGELVREEGM